MISDSWEQATSSIETEIEEQPFSTSEFEERVNRVQSTIRDRGLNALLVTTPENIYYLSGLDTTGFYSYQCLIVPQTGEPAFVVRQLETPNVEIRTWISQWKAYGESYGDDSVETTRGVDATTKLLREMDLADGRLGFEQDSWFITYHQVTLLEEAIPGELIGCSDIIEPERAIKSDSELEYIREAASIVEAGTQAGVDTVGTEVGENDIAANTYSGLIRNGAMHGTRVYVTSGTRSALPHARWKGRTVRRGEPVNFEVGAAVNRYYASLWQTAHAGDTLPPVIERVEDAITTGLQSAIDRIRPGVPAAEVHQACQGVLREAGYGEFSPHRTGYSLGIGFPPGWGEGHIISIGPGDDTPLEQNMVFHMPVTVILPNYGTVGTSVTLRVADDGVEILADLNRTVHRR